MYYSILRVLLSYYVVMYIIIIFYIFRSRVKNEKFKEVTIKEIEKPVKNWMAQATARIKKQK